MSVVQPMKLDTGIENSDTWWLLMILDDIEGVESCIWSAELCVWKHHLIVKLVSLVSPQRVKSHIRLYFSNATPTNPPISNAAILVVLNFSVTPYSTYSYWWWSISWDTPVSLVCSDIQVFSDSPVCLLLPLTNDWWLLTNNL